MIIHLHFHSRTTGITKSIESIFPVLNKYTDARIFGYGIGLPRINLPSLLKHVFSGKKVVIHAHRNNEIIFALLIRLIGGRFKLVFTRHAETRPSGFTAYLMKQADVLISLTHSMSQILKIKNTIVRHGVDSEKFCIGEKKRIKGITQENLISVIGRVRPSKGQLVVLSAITDLLRIHQDWGLILVGKIDEKYYAREILSKAEKNGIASQVHFIPETSKIVDIYHASKVVVIASPSEGFSLVCLEALACGIITVASESVGVHSDVITPGENGFLFPPGDHIVLNKILSGIINDEVKPDPEKMRQNIIDNWDLEKSVSSMLKIYGIEHETKTSKESVS